MNITGGRHSGNLSIQEGRYELYRIAEYNFILVKYRQTDNRIEQW